MKKAVSTLMMLIAFMAIAVACQKNDGGGGGGETYAETPAQNCNVPNSPHCQAAQPNYYQQNAPQFLPYQWTTANAFCGCPVGYRPVINFNWGVSCAPNAWFPTADYYSGAQYGGYTYQQVIYGPQNGQWTSIPQVTYSPAVAGSANCYAQASTVCDIRAPTTCPNGGICRAMGGSYQGLCTLGTTSDVYGYPQHPYQQNGCYRYNGYTWINVCQYGSGGSTTLPR